MNKRNKDFIDNDIDTDFFEDYSEDIQSEASISEIIIAGALAVLTFSAIGLKSCNDKTTDEQPTRYFEQIID